MSDIGRRARPEMKVPQAAEARIETTCAGEVILELGFTRDLPAITEGPVVRDLGMLCQLREAASPVP